MNSSVLVAILARVRSAPGSRPEPILNEAGRSLRVGRNLW